MKQLMQKRSKVFGNSSGYLVGPVCRPWHLFLGLHRFCGHKGFLDSPLSNVGRDVRNLDLHISAAPKALLKFDDSVRGNIAWTISAFTWLR